VTPNFYFISETSKSLSLRSRSLKEIYRVENFRANVLKSTMSFTVCPGPVPVDMSSFTPEKGTVVTNILNEHRSCLLFLYMGWRTINAANSRNFARLMTARGLSVERNQLKRCKRKRNGRSRHFR